MNRQPNPRNSIEGTGVAGRPHRRVPGAEPQLLTDAGGVDHAMPEVRVAGGAVGERHAVEGVQLHRGDRRLVGRVVDPPVDARGWPATDASIVVWHGIGNMNGTYRLSFTGQADVSTYWGAATISNKQYNPATNTTTATLTNTEVLRVARLSGAGTSYGDHSDSGIDLKRRVITDAESVLQGAEL